MIAAEILRERVLNDRLSGEFSSAEPLFPYLVACYRRAHDESKKIQSMKDKSLRSEMEIVTRAAKKFAVSYCRIRRRTLFSFHGGEDLPMDCETRRRRNKSDHR
ncbi:hypothetical protein F2Q70_00033783 [Brassica cretica]|uniref:Uncharacterized protein n=1 Tax=Brassica cretica TaxID=69181 RepID=A0A8S9JYA8_BRACR|nr:hypothetical protein F2Q68_00028663 [Brassica cretica]KAF2586829.1 hypothetical protein F2Q70_00033783 [Brassica cretica]